MKKTLRLLTLSAVLLTTASISNVTHAWGLNSTSQQIGNIYYENYSNGVNCTTQIIGKIAYRNCF